MKLHQSTAEIFVPDGKPIAEALARTTHLAVGAHQDDLEIMAAEPILKCFQQPDLWFTGVAVTDGRGSPRAGQYQSHTDEEMRLVRFHEQKKAAFVGEYAAQIILDYSSTAVKDSTDKFPVEDLVLILKASQPQYVYTHNLADKHDTHVAVALKLIEAIQHLRKEERPLKLYGCEVWRDLDWMSDEDKVPFDLSAHENLQAALLGVHDSQIAGGKRYDLATMGRRKSHSTYFVTHGTDTMTGLSFGMDMTALVNEPEIDPATFVRGFVERFAQDIDERLKRLRQIW